MTAFLGFIELRTNEILHAHSLHLQAHHQQQSSGSSEHPGETRAFLGSGPQVPAGSQTLQIEHLPTTAEEYVSEEESEEEVDDRPLTKCEVEWDARVLELLLAPTNTGH